MLLSDAIVAPSWKAKSWLSEPMVVGLVRLGDCCVVALAGIAAYVTRFQGNVISDPELYALIIGVILVANVFEFARVYGDGRLSEVTGRTSLVFRGLTLVMLLLISIGFITKMGQEVSRVWVGLWFAYGLVALPLWRFLLNARIRFWQENGFLVRNVAVIGAPSQCERLVERLQQAGDPALRLLGIFLLDEEDMSTRREMAAQQVRGGLEELRQLARRVPIDQVVIAMPWDAQEKLDTCARRLSDLPTDVSLFPPFDLSVPCRRVTHAGGIPLLHVLDKPLSGWGSMIKLVEDRLFAAAVVVAASPLMLLIATAIYVDSGRPIIFRQKRYGFNSTVIEVLKFRTMFPSGDAENGLHQVRQARPGDPRMTPVGRFLRRTSLDELPQFINVLKGEMSIVGPRPHAVVHNEHYSQLIDSYLARHRVKPGITGWAQVNGLRGETSTLEKMERRVEHDLYYIEHWSLAFDLRIIFRTLWVAFVNPHAV